jgi:malonyl-CoA O-methyltransferase
MAEPRFPDKLAVRRSFERAAATYDDAAALQREIGQRLMEHFDGILLEPTRIIDLGCGTGMSFDALRKRFPGGDLIGMDFALPMLKKARARTSWLRRVVGQNTARLACGDAERLPVRSASIQLVFSNLALQWCRPELAFAEAARVLEPGGLFMFSTFGPDTLKELRSAFAAVDGDEHVNTFIDMHDLGDTLVHSGFADPVMEMEVVTLEYFRVEDVARDLKAIGAHNSLPGRPRGLGGRERWKRVKESYELRRGNGVLPATYEVVYGHAWKVPPKHISDGRQVMDFVPRTYK